MSIREILTDIRNVTGDLDTARRASDWESVRELETELSDLREALSAQHAAARA